MLWCRLRHFALRQREFSSLIAPERLAVVDIRSDTVTLPSAAVRSSAFHAQVGDDVFAEDPTAIQLEQRVADLLGKEAGVLMPSATMANLAALAANVPMRGAAVLCGKLCHILRWEQEGAMSLLGMPLRPIPAPRKHPGELCIDALRSQLSAVEDIHVANIGAVTLENTHAECGGRALSLEYMHAASILCRQYHVPLHVDGARLANAAAVLAARKEFGIEEALRVLAAPATTVSFCLSKGLGAPMGAVLTGTSQTMHAARRVRKLLGGGMRQIGMMAGAAMAALDENLDRVAEDNALAAVLYDGLSSIPGLRVSPRFPDSTNFVLFELDGDAEMGAEEQLMASMRAHHNVLLGYGYEPGQLRAVLHRDVSAEGVSRTIEGIQQELRVLRVKSDGPKTHCKT